MIEHTDEEILAKAQSIFDEEVGKSYVMGWERKGCLSVSRKESGDVLLTVKCMYEAPSPTLSVLSSLAAFFGTTNINDDDHFANGGCETCDYGSSYGYTLVIRPEKLTSKEIAC